MLKANAGSMSMRKVSLYLSGKHSNYSINLLMYVNIDYMEGH
jgi:hypothetical protein